MFQQCSPSLMYVIGRTGGRVIGMVVVRVLDLLFPLPTTFGRGAR